MSDTNEQARQIFHAALSLDSLDDPLQRADYLDVACRGDEGLRKQVDSLLASHAAAGEFMESSAVSAQHINSPVELPTESIGRYKLLQQIGEGGFGIVYMAEQQEPVRRRVALKVIKPGMDTKQVIGRFEAERQALAMLDHPNIAKVYDAGATEQGRPYFVMELVRGEPITQFCDANCFDTTKRLKLFVDVCSAIQHAHQKGIIHRDIKPSNVLVTIIDDHPVPKVIDFGIAKATAQRLTERTLFTEFKQFLGTPAYMSPEQASLSGTDVDTRSDVYSLGVLLYELLSGVPPFDDRQLRAMGHEEICRVIRETVPPAPSNRISTLGAQTSSVTKNRGADIQTLRSKLRGEVDWIVMKSLEKDRARRYDTTIAMADDIRRFLDQEPVLAGPPSAVYRLQKFMQRNRTATFSGLAIAAALLIGTVAAFVGMFHAFAALDEAKTQTARAVDAEAVSQQRADDLSVSETRLRRNLYVAKMAAAKRDFDHHTIALAVETLEKYAQSGDGPDMRGFEWRWLWNQTNQENFQLAGGSVYKPDEGPLVRDMCFSADGKWLVSGGTDGYVRLWDMTAKKEVWRFKIAVHCNTVDISNDSKLLLANGWLKNPQGGTFLFDISNPEAPVEIARVEGHGSRFTPDGKRLINHTGAEFDFSGQQVREPYDGDNDIGQTYSKDRITVATKDSIWDVPSRTLLARLPAHDGYNDIHGPIGIAISPIDNNLIATACAEGVRLWDREGNLIHWIAGTGGTALGWLSFSAEGDMLAVREFTGSVRVFETTAWTEVASIAVPYPNSSVLFSPVDNNLLVAAGLDGVIRGYSVSAKDVADVSFDHSSEILALKFSPDGRYLAAGAADGSVLFWDVSSRTRVFTTPVTVTERPYLRYHNSHGPDYLAFSPDNRYVAIAGTRTLSVWDLESWQVAAEWTIPDDEIPDGKTNRQYGAACFSTDGKKLFGANYRDEWLDIWNWPPTDDEFRPVEKHATQAKCLDVSNDGRLATISLKSLCMWRLSDMQLVHSGLPSISDDIEIEIGNNLAFSQNGQRLAVTNLSVKILDVSTWKVVATLPHSNPIEHASWSPDGTQLAASDMTATTRLWDIDTQKPVATFRGSISAFSPDGTILAVGGQGSKYIGDTKHINRVTLYYAPPLNQIDARRIGPWADKR